MIQIAQEQKYILLIAPVRRGRPQQRAAEGKTFPLLIVLIYLYLEKLIEEFSLTSNAIQYAGDWDAFASSMGSFDTWSGVITSGAGALVTNCLGEMNLGTKVEKLTGKDGKTILNTIHTKVDGFNFSQIGSIQNFNSLVGGLATSALSYGLTGEATFNVLNISNFGAGASCGLLEVSVGNDGVKTRLGTGGTDVSVGTLLSAISGIKNLGMNEKIKKAAQENNMAQSATALRMLYGFGDDKGLELLDDVLNKRASLAVGSDPGNAQTILESSKRTVYLNGYKKDMTREEQLKLGITLGHEAYRDGVKGDELTQKIETRNAVAGHTDMMTRMLGDSMYAGTLSSIIAGDRNLQLDLIARSLGDDVFNDYVDNCYDSSADYWKVKLDGTIEKTDEKAFFREYIDENGVFQPEKIEGSEYAGSDTLALINAVGGIKNFLSLDKIKGTENYKVKGLAINDSLGVTRNAETGKYTFFTAGLDFTREDNAFSVYDDGKGGYKKREEVSYADRDNTDTTFWMKDVFTGKDIHRETFNNSFTSIDNTNYKDSIVSEYFNMRLIPYTTKTYGVDTVGLFSNAYTATGNQIAITGNDGKTKGRYLYHPTDQLGKMEGCFGPMSDLGIGNFNSLKTEHNISGHTGAFYYQQQLNLYHSLGIYNGYQFNIHLTGKLKP